MISRRYAPPAAVLIADYARGRRNLIAEFGESHPVLRIYHAHVFGAEQPSDPGAASLSHRGSRLALAPPTIRVHQERTLTRRERREISDRLIETMLAPITPMTPHERRLAEQRLARGGMASWRAGAGSPPSPPADRAPADGPVDWTALEAADGPDPLADRPPPAPPPPTFDELMDHACEQQGLLLDRRRAVRVRGRARSDHGYARKAGVQGAPARQAEAALAAAEQAVADADAAIDRFRRRAEPLVRAAMAGERGMRVKDVRVLDEKGRHLSTLLRYQGPAGRSPVGPAGAGESVITE